LEDGTFIGADTVVANAYLPYAYNNLIHGTGMTSFILLMQPFCYPLPGNRHILGEKEKVVSFKVLRLCFSAVNILQSWPTSQLSLSQIRDRDMKLERHISLSLSLISISISLYQKSKQTDIDSGNRAFNSRVLTERTCCLTAGTSIDRWSKKLLQYNYRWEHSS
jgi:hypothetical protein